MKQEELEKEVYDILVNDYGLRPNGDTFWYAHWIAKGTRDLDEIEQAIRTYPQEFSPDVRVMMYWYGISIKEAQKILDIIGEAKAKNNSYVKDIISVIRKKRGTKKQEDNPEEVANKVLEYNY